MDPHSPNKLIATKYCFLILGDQFLFHSFFLFVMLCHCTYFNIINFLQKLYSYSCSYSYSYYLLNYYLIIFIKNILIFSCSEMFRNVPCSWFYRRPLLLEALLRSVHAWVARSGSSLSCVRLDFPLPGNFYVRTCVKFTLANKIEAIYERLHVSVKVEPRSTSRLVLTLNILPLFYLCDYYFRALTSVNVP